MHSVRVEAGRPYDVQIGYGLLQTVGQALAAVHAACRVALVTDERVASGCGAQVEASLARAGYSVFMCVIPSGERTKSLQTYGYLLEQFATHGLSRDGVVVAVGGGMTGDVAGFAAATYLRGVEYVQVPTTLLAAVDASVGGKTGVNLPQGKNLAGAFWQPILVVCDCDTFTTLPRETFLDGVAECLKYGVLCDRVLFEQVAQGGLDEDCLDIVARCVAIKAEYVAADERDRGQRQMLNLGHTIGHAIELLSGYTVSHGCAVAIGMVGVARIAEILEVSAIGCSGVLMAMMDRLGLPSETSFTADELAQAAAVDKKHVGDTVTLVLPESIGRCVLRSTPFADLPRLFRYAKGERA